jgi:uncharacterized protein
MTGDYEVLMLCSMAAPFAGGDSLSEEAKYRLSYAVFNKLVATRPASIFDTRTLRCRAIDCLRSFRASIRPDACAFRVVRIGDVVDDSRGVVRHTVEPGLIEDPFLTSIEARVGRLHARQRLGIECDCEAQVFGQTLNFFHTQNLSVSLSVTEWVLKIAGLYWRGKKNAQNIIIRENIVTTPSLPSSFDGFTILHMSDLHADISEAAIERLSALLPRLAYDICALTGDFRGKTFGPFEGSLERIREVRRKLKSPVYAVLGNHDTIRMTPGLESMDIRVLLNESHSIERSGERVYIVGVDDPHFYRADNLEKAVANIPSEGFSILLTHTPEIFRQAAHADFDLLLAGHTHGGQICLPGGTPITLSAKLPRSLGSGAWTFGKMSGYTSAGVGTSLLPVRFNCPPEITLHRLTCANFS